MLVSLNVFLANALMATVWWGQSTESLVALFFLAPLDVCLFSQTGWSYKTSPNNRTMSALAGLWWTQLPNSNNFKTQVWSKDLTQASDTAADWSGHWAGPSSAVSPRPTFHQQARDALSSFSKVNSLLNSIQITFPSWKGHTQWKLWMCQGPLVGGSGGPAGLGSSRSSRSAGQLRLCSAATTGDMEDPFGSLSSDLLLVVCSVM